MTDAVANSRSAILYAEDEEDDVLLLNLALKQARLPHTLQVVTNGDDAVAYLRGEGPFADRQQHPLPGLVLLDLHLPRRSGLEVLHWIRQQSDLARLPVVVYTSSEQPSDIKQAKELWADDYIVKPPILEQIATILQRITQRWLPS